MDAALLWSIEKVGAVVEGALWVLYKLLSLSPIGVAKAGGPLIVGGELQVTTSQPLVSILIYLYTVMAEVNLAGLQTTIVGETRRSSREKHETERRKLINSADRRHMHFWTPSSMCMPEATSRPRFLLCD